MLTTYNRKRKSFFSKFTFTQKVDINIPEKKLTLKKNLEADLNNPLIKNDSQLSVKNAEKEMCNLSGFSHELIIEKPIDVNEVLRNKYIIYPDSLLKSIWELTGMLFIIYQSLSIPYRICFDSKLRGFLAYFEIFQDTYFMLDILINLNTGIYKEGVLIMNRKIIIIEYLKLWFWLDLISSLPFDIIVSEYSSINSNETSTNKITGLFRMIKIVRVIRMIKLIRLGKINKIFKSFGDFMMKDSIYFLIHIFRVILVNLLISHWGACLWYYIGRLELDHNYHSWLSQSNYQDLDDYSLYITSIYYFISTTCTVGYGDIIPVTPTEKIFACINMFIACGVFSYNTGEIGILMSVIYYREIDYREKIANLNAFLKKKNIDKSLKLKIKNYMGFMLDNVIEEKIEEHEIYEILKKKNLRDEVFLEINKWTLQNLIVIQNYDEFCILLTKFINIEYFYENENIFEKGSESDRIYFISKGQVIIYDNDTKIIYKKLLSENLFGEIGFFSNNPRIASSNSLSFSTLKFINKNDFEKCLLQYKSASINFNQNFLKLKNDLEKLSKDIKTNNIKSLNILCYICDSKYHFAPNCKRLRIIDELYKFKYKDGKPKRPSEMKSLQEFILKNQRSILEFNKLETNKDSVVEN